MAHQPDSPSAQPPPSPPASAGAAGWDLQPNWKGQQPDQLLSHAAHPQHADPETPPPQPNGPKAQRHRLHVAVWFAAALLVAMASAGGGAAIALTMQRNPPVTIAMPANHAPSASQPTPGTPPGSIEKVAAKVLPSVVELQTRVGGMLAEGSGVVLTTDGLILTNNHVVAAAANAGPLDARRTMTLVTFNDGRTAAFRVVGTDPSTDIAVVRAEHVSGLTPITLGSSAKLRVGQQVVAVGSPLGLEGTVTSGIISAVDRPVHVGGPADQGTYFDAIQTDAAINPGNSGGALVNMNGALIGLNSAVASLGGPDRASGSIGLGFAVPIDQVHRIANELIATGIATHASLGLEVVNDENVHGARVVAVLPGGPASSAGIPTGAVITRADDHIITDSVALVALVRSTPPGKKLSLTFVDPAGATRTTEVTLATQQPVAPRPTIDRA